MKKILHIITLSEIGGAQKVLYLIVKYLKNDFDITVATSAGGELVNWIRDLNVRVYEINELERNISLKNDIISFFKIYKLIRNNKFDVVHCHSWKAGVIGRLAAFLAGTEKIYFTVHGWSKLNSNSKIVKLIYLFIEKVLGYITGRIICVCDRDKQLGISLNIASSDKILTIYNGIEKSIYNGNADIKLELGVPSNSIVIGTVARLAEPKMLIETVDVMKELFCKIENLYFIWIGGGPQFNHIKQYIDRSNISDRFLLTGQKEEVHKFLKIFDIYILLSGYEGLPISILEAMNIGLPVIASNVGGICEQVYEDINGYLIENDLEGFHDKVLSLIENKEKRTLFGNNSREIFESMYTIDKMMEGYKNLYD